MNDLDTNLPKRTALFVIHITDFQNNLLLAIKICHKFFPVFCMKVIFLKKKKLLNFIAPFLLLD